MNIREWNEDLTVDGKVIPAEQIRYAVIEMLDYQKNPWYIANMSFGFVRRKVKTLLEDATPGWFPDPDPLVWTDMITVDGEKFPITKVRVPKTPEEREYLQRTLLYKPNGEISSYTAAKLALQDCPRCKGESTYRVQTHPNDKRLFWQTHTEYCPCIFN